MEGTVCPVDRRQEQAMKAHCVLECELEKRVCVRPRWNLLTFYAYSELIWSEFCRIRWNGLTHGKSRAENTAYLVNDRCSNSSK